MEILNVGLGQRSYPIKIGAGCLDNVAEDLAAHFQASRYCIVADDTVAELYAGKLLESVRQRGLNGELIVFPHGEENKTLETVGRLASEAAKRGLDRRSMFIALGGGVTGDITGFLASAYMRGIPFVQVPTTLLSQVDSSVGGKTGVDIPEGKNLVGAFYQPGAVYIDTKVLKSLPESEYLSGLAEVIKYGFIWESQFLSFLLENREKLMQLDESPVVRMIYTCCRIKAEVVEGDERESDRRRILNFGHTIGHAVEAASEFRLSHGFAVAIGMVAAARLGVLRKTVSNHDAQVIHDAVKAFGLPTEIPEHLDRVVIKSYLGTDKKNIAGKLFFVLPKAIGDVVITDEVTEADIDSLLYT